MIEVVWFKRDLRVLDHAPLSEASRRGPLLPLYIVEPSLVAGEDYDPCHWTFTSACLEQLRADLAALGQPLAVRVGEVLPVLAQIHAEHTIARLWSHEETGNALTYQRDLAVGRWARATGIEWKETPNGGVLRRLPSRDGWARRWESSMAAPIVPPPVALARVPLSPGPIPTGSELGLCLDRRTGAQPGGARAARVLLDTFLDERGHRYHLEMSSPVTAAESCSRLSPHLAYGTISTRMVVQQLRARLKQTDDAGLRRAWRAFDARLHWRDHFMQKLEDEPAIEHHNFVRGFDGLRENDFDAARFAAWAVLDIRWWMLACGALAKPAGSTFECAPCSCRLPPTIFGCIGARLASIWPGSSSTMSRAFIGASVRCSPAPPVSIRSASTILRSRRRITTRTARSFAVGSQNLPRGQTATRSQSSNTRQPRSKPGRDWPNFAGGSRCARVSSRLPRSTAAAKADRAAGNLVPLPNDPCPCLKTPRRMTRQTRKVDGAGPRQSGCDSDPGRGVAKERSALPVGAGADMFK